MPKSYSAPLLRLPWYTYLGDSNPPFRNAQINSHLPFIPIIKHKRGGVELFRRKNRFCLQKEHSERMEWFCESHSKLVENDSKTNPESHFSSQTTPQTTPHDQFSSYTSSHTDQRSSIHFEHL
jgi:hypothetical protein